MPAARRRSGPSAPRARRTRARPRRTRAGSAAPRRPAGRARHRGGACTRQSPRPDLARRSGCCRVPRPRLYHTLRPKAGGCEGRSVFTFALSEEERLIQETARRFARDRLRPALRTHERARGVPGALAAEFAALGLDAVDVPAGAGGQGLGAFAKSLVLEELAAVDPGAALALDGAGLALPTLAEGGLQALIGELRREPGRRGVVIEDVEGRLGVRDGRLVGEHPWVAADAVAVAVVFHAAQAFVVREGFGLAPIAACGLEAAGAARLIFDHAPIAATLEEPHALARARARTRTAVAALLVGAA
ncbi:MAG: acyl-CoA dehydrogenase family protein, partial [Deltaproteobacteria bacterium]